MRLLIASSILAASFAITAPAAAKRGFDSTVTAPLSSAVKLEIVLSEDMLYRANNLPEKLSDRGNARSSRSGFSGNGFYGEKDLNRLTERLESKLEQRLVNN